MKQYKVISTQSSSFFHFEESINSYAEQGYVVKFLTQSEDGTHIHCTALLEKEVE